MSFLRTALAPAARHHQRSFHPLQQQQQRGYLSMTHGRRSLLRPAVPAACTPRNFLRIQNFPQQHRPRSFATKVNMDLIKKLRVRANAGIMDCKAALQETLENPEYASADEMQIIRAAMDLLRQRGIAKASSKSGREAKEGLVTMLLENEAEDGTGSRATIMELNCETDFVSNTDGFREMCTEVNQFVHTLLQEDPSRSGLSQEALNELTVPGNPQTLKDFISEKVIEFGENLGLRRAATLEAGEKGILGTYVHNRVDLEKKFPVRMGRTIGAIALEAPSLSPEAARELAKTLAIHVVAAESRYLTREDVPESEVEHEKGILLAQLKESGQDQDKFVDRKVEGRLRKYFEEIVLLEQPMVAPEFGAKAPSVAEYLVQKAGKDAKINGFLRFEVGV